MKKDKIKAKGFHAPQSSRNMEPGFKIPVPGHDDLRPGMRNVDYKWGSSRQKLALVNGTDQIHDFGSPDNYPPQSPASAQYIVGLRKSPVEKDTDPGDITIQPGIPRVR